MPFFLVPIIGAAAAALYVCDPVGGSRWGKPPRSIKNTKRWSLADELSRQNQPRAQAAPQTVNQGASNTLLAPVYRIASEQLNVVKQLASETEDRYQSFVQSRFDRMLGAVRHAHARELAGSEQPVTDAQRIENRRLGLATMLASSAVASSLYPPLVVITVPLYMAMLVRTWQRAYRDFVKRRRLSFPVMVTCYATGILLTGNFLPGALGMVVDVILGKIEGSTKRRAKQQLGNVFGQQPRTAWVSIDGAEVEIPFDKLAQGDKVRVHAGQVIPADGEVVDGKGLVDQHRLTGESQPVACEKGQAVYATTLLLSGALLVEVKKAGRETLAAEIVRVLEQTTEHHLQIELKGKDLAERTMQPAFCAAILISPFLGAQTAVALIGASAPGAELYFAAPITLLNFLNFAAERQILVKDGRSLESLQDVKHVVFDKTGTLTLEQPIVTGIYVLGSFTENDVLSCAATAERHQTHPIARAILAAGQERGAEVMAPEQASYEVGYGVQVTAPASGARPQPFVICVGSERFMELKRVPIPNGVSHRRTEAETMGRSLIFVAVDGELGGMIELSPSVRPEARHVVEELKRRGIAVSIVSGDQEAPTRSLAAQLGIDEYYANVLPQAKGDLIRKLQQGERSVCFVGDGINDAIALKQAKVSISLVGATTVATDTAQIVMMDKSLENLPLLFDLTREMERNLHTSFLLSAGGSYAVMASVLFLGAGVPTALFYAYVLMAGVFANTMLPVVKRRHQAAPKAGANCAISSPEPTTPRSLVASAAGMS